MARIDAYPNKNSSPSDARVVTSTDVTGNKVALDVQVAGGSVSGTLTPSGLKTDFRITTEDVTSVAASLPSGGNLTARNALAVTNLSTTDTIYIGKPSVTADRVNGVTSGWEVGPGETFQLDITDAITLYAITETGATVKVKIFEVA